MNPIKGKLNPIKDYVIVSGMNFGEQQTKAGIIIKSDDGKVHGVRPRWGLVHAIGPEQKEVSVGEWILVEHGRWTHGFEMEDENGESITLRRVDAKNILATTDEVPSDVQLGKEYNDGEHATVDPSVFMNQ